MRPHALLHDILNTLQNEADVRRFAHYSDVHRSDLYTTIIELNQEDDERKNISSYFLMSEGKRCHVRDARFVDPTEVIYGSARTDQNFLMMGINYTQALLVLLRSHHIEFDETTLLAAAENFRVHAKMAGDKNSLVPYLLGFENYFYEYLLQVLVPLLLCTGLVQNEKAAIQLLDSVKDWVSLEHEPMALVTVDHFKSAVTGKFKKVIRMDIPVYELTDEQRQELQDYENEYWYTRLTPVLKKVYHYYLPNLLQGRVLPSQLRSCIPILKNAYHHYLYLVDENDHCRQLLNVLHCGGIPYFDKKIDPNLDEMRRVARMNVVQQRVHFENLAKNEGRSMQHHFITLCSEQGDAYLVRFNTIRDFFKRLKKGFRRPAVPFIGFDAHIVKMTREAVREYDNGFSSNICLNAMRILEPNDYYGIVKILDTCEAVAKELETLKKKKLAKQLREKLQDLRGEIGSFHLNLARARLQPRDTFWKKCRYFFLNFLEFPRLFFHYFLDKRVSNMQLLGHLASLCELLDVAFEEQHNPNIPRINLSFGCASGENRTGLTEFHLQCQALADACPDVVLQEIQHRLALSGHVQLITGYQGGNAGMQGIRSKSMGSLPRDYPEMVRRLFVTRGSDMKSVSDSIKGYDKYKKQRALFESKHSLPPFMLKAQEKHYQYWFFDKRSEPEKVKTLPIVAAKSIVDTILAHSIYFSAADLRRLKHIELQGEETHTIGEFKRFGFGV